MFTTISKRLVSTVESAMAPVSSGETAGVRGRPSWSGLLRLSLVTVPVKAYPAHSGAAAIQFNQLHANCGRRIQHQKRCPVHGAVDAAEITHVYQYGSDQYVLVEPEEVEKLRPAKDKALVLSSSFPCTTSIRLYMPEGVSTWSRMAWRRGIRTPWWRKPWVKRTSGLLGKLSCPPIASWC